MNGDLHTNVGIVSKQIYTVQIVPVITWIKDLIKIS